MAFRVLVVGAGCENFVESIVRAVGDEGIEIHHCDDIYLAAVELHKIEGSKILVAGRIKTLAAEAGRFLEKLNEKNILCCCLADDEILNRYNMVCDLKEKGVFVGAGGRDIEQTVCGLIRDGIIGSKQGGFKSRKIILGGQGLVASQAEIDALLDIDIGAVDDD